LIFFRLKRGRLCNWSDRTRIETFTAMLGICMVGMRKLVRTFAEPRRASCLLRIAPRFAITLCAVWDGHAAPLAVRADCNQSI
jgi:hypothetical protein